MKDEALKLALEALGEIEWSNNSQWQSDRAKVAMTAIKQVLAAPVQEPVAWMVYAQDGKSVYVTDNPTDIQEGQRALPLYTTQPAAQRPWVGLTDEEKQAANGEDGSFGAGAFWAEAKLKQRNT